MMLMVIVFVFLYLPAHQMKAEEEKCPRVCYCSNKTVATCKDLKVDGINTTSELKFEPGIETLDISGNKLNLSQNTFSEWNVLNLHFFNLSGNNILNITKFTFSGFSKLKNLDLSRNGISWIDCEAFELTLNMTVLRLRSNRLTAICPHTFTALVHLWHLDLSNNMISSIQLETFHKNSVLEWLSLANNRLNEIHLRIFQNQSKLSYLDLSGNNITKIEGAMFYCNRKLDVLLLTSSKTFEFIASDFRNESVLNISKISDEAFVGLENLKHLDLSSNNVRNISLTVFHNMLPQAEGISSEGTCVSKVNGLNSSNNSFNFGKYHSSNLTSIILHKMELSELREYRLTIFDDSPGNVLNTSRALINLTGIPHTYECSLSQDIYENIDVTSLSCFSEENLSMEKCNNSEPNDVFTTVDCLSSSIDGNVNTTGKNLKKVPQPYPPESILIFAIYASSVFVAIVVVLVITHVVGKPEPDDFWWEDKLAKRSY